MSWNGSDKFSFRHFNFTMFSALYQNEAAPYGYPEQHLIRTICNFDITVAVHIILQVVILIFALSLLRGKFQVSERVPTTEGN